MAIGRPGKAWMGGGCYTTAPILSNSAIPMSRLLEFSHHHPYLIGAAFLIAVLFIADTVARRLRKFRDIAPGEAVLLINKGAKVIDVRAAKDFAEGHIIGARNIPAAEFEGRVAELEKFREQPVVVYCESGHTSLRQAAVLTKNGFQNVSNLKGGLTAWRKESMPVERN